jgi:3-phytase
MRNSAHLLLILALATAAAASPPVVVKEFFSTTRQPAENIDSPAVWHGRDGQHWLLATSKEGHSLNVFDAVNGMMIRRVGGLGAELGQFNRPNGVWVVDDYAFVVERDNRRVQILSLPDLVGLASFGEAELRKPYGLWVHPQGPGEYKVYVTDSYETASGDLPPPAALGERVRVYLAEAIGSLAEGELVGTFGATEGPGVLHVVESLHGDPAHQRLLIADEDENPARGMNIKIYDLEGNFSGKTMGDGLFRYQAEGIALYPTGATSGYWVCVDQGKVENLFHVFDRETLAHVGTFSGERTLNTDGIWLAADPLPRFPAGALYAADADAAITAFCWAEIAAALGLEQ